MPEHTCIDDVRHIIHAVVYSEFVAVLEIGFKLIGCRGGHPGPVFCKLDIEDNILQGSHSVELEGDGPGFFVQGPFNPPVSVESAYGDYRFLNIAGIIGYLEAVFLFHTAGSNDKKQCRDCQRKVFLHFVF